MSRLHPRHRFLTLSSALCLGAAPLVAVAAPAASASPVGCRIDRTLDTATYTCPEGEWYAAVVQCLGTRKLGINGVQSPTYIVGDSPRPLIPMTIECTGDGKTGVVLNAWTEGPF
ncbi:hypothetical protein [Nocardia huaxiensis]|uniref:Ig-like domain-containing protein n=1 Tax=Nocardia huaxiensis TaxID=2755382 RepID=A0A7D6ZJ66_9NOCA|nr:hypothetical protein [Nocardia huaxiensis]QLY29023.1 hypothetical protein H0264_27415 [Nocardia huaxiensis]UFS97494.1 hypothetical protein LPY97_06190 [Nocardia huaxiensis]